MPAEENTNKSGLPRWFKVTTIVFLVLANIAAAGILWFVNVGQGALAEADTDDAVTDVLDISTGDLTFLVIGSDTREGLEDLKNFGTAGGERGDVIMLVRVNRDGTARMLSIPRDLWVDIPGHGMEKINAAYAFGGPTLMVRTVKENLDVEINHYVEVDFVGFMDMIDEIGGVEIHFPYPARDSSSGLDVDAGNLMLDGKTALAYARSRKYQELQNGSWVSVAANDIGRTQRQQEVVRAIMSSLKSPSSIPEAGEIAGSLARHMTIDSRLAGSSVAQMAWDFRGILGGNIEGATLPVVAGTVGNASVVHPDEPAAANMLRNFASGQPLAQQPVRVQVLNGNGVPGAAGDMARQLESLGFVVIGVGDSDERLPTTRIMVASGSDAGTVIAGELGFGEVVTGSVDNDVDAVVIVSSDAA
ncbi:MAG: LCP family protein [Acidimicrobiia bacterium]